MKQKITTKYHKQKLFIFKLVFKSREHFHCQFIVFRGDAEVAIVKILLIFMANLNYYTQFGENISHKSLPRLR